MLVHLILPVLLLLAAMLYIVPAVTDSGVAVRKDSILRGLLALVVIALSNHIFFHALLIAGVTLAVPSTLLTIGAVGFLATALGIFVTGRIMPGVLYVRSFAAAMGASLILMIGGWLISQFLI
jgi:uncharacterized membrane protein YvlD (DUF360 family)